MPARRCRRRLAGIACLVLGFALLIPTVASATSTDQAVAYQLDAAHDGYQTASPITAPLSPIWSTTLPGSISYPLIVNGVVYVTEGDNSQGHGTTLYALDQATGATLWSQSLGGLAPWSGLAYDAGKVFTVNSNGKLTAFDAATGAIDWSTGLPGQSSFSSAPTATAGYVYIGGAGSGGTLYAVAEETGRLAWTATVENGDESSPAVDSSGVYVTYAAGQDYAFNPLTGTLLWHYNTSGGEGGGGKTPVLADGYVFGRDDISGNTVLSASAGTSAGSFSSTPAPAVGGGQAYMLSGGGLTSVNGSGLGTNAWWFTGDSHLDSAPLRVGNLVFEGSSSGEIYAIDMSGTSVWSANAGSAIPAPDEHNSSQPLTGLGAGEGTLIVPAGSRLVAYAGANVGSGTPANTSAPTVTGTPAIGQTIAADVGTWSALPTSYTYRWERCDPTGSACASIGGVTSESYTPTSADNGSTLEVGVTATNAGGTSALVPSAPSPIVLGPPTNLTAAAITGSAIEGQTLTASHGGWTQSPTSYHYQWLRCDAGSCTAEPNSTAGTYVVDPSDIGMQIEVQVIASNALGNSTAVVSPPTAKVAALAPATPPIPPLTAPITPEVIVAAETPPDPAPANTVSPASSLRRRPRRSHSSVFASAASSTSRAFSTTVCTRRCAARPPVK